MSDASGTSEQQFAFDGKIQEDRFTVDVFFRRQENIFFL
jgi:hypothetical protein